MKESTFTRPLAEMSRAGLRAASYPADIDDTPLESLLGEHTASEPPPLPELCEPDVVRHFVNLSHKNMSVDTHFYPLGSCTMKYNPKRHERLAALPGIADLHPYATRRRLAGHAADDVRDAGAAGRDQRLAGRFAAAGGRCSWRVHRAAVCCRLFPRSRRDPANEGPVSRKSAHGTNPASAAAAGFDTVQLNSTVDGMVDIDELKSKLGDDTAVFMITNPNTVGLFEKDIKHISDLVHEAGGLVYIDGANLNAICGLTRPGDFGGDMMHFNVHKTFTGPTRRRRSGSGSNWRL